MLLCEILWLVDWINDRIKPFRLLEYFKAFVKFSYFNLEFPYFKKAVNIVFQSSLALIFHHTLIINLTND